MTASLDITTQQRKVLLALLRRFIPGVEVWAYGSRVKWQSHPASDLDLVVFTAPEQRRQFSDLKDALAEANLPFIVGVHVWAEEPERFQEIIRKDHAVLQEAGGGKLHGLSGWREMTIGELTENFDGQRIPVKETDRKPGPYPYYGASGVVDHVDQHIFDGEYLLIAEDGENLRTRKTPVAFLACGKFWVNNHAHIVTANERGDTRFLMYALNNGDISGYLTGSTMPKLTQGNMNRIPILAPPPSEQRAIASVLGALDDKIELNRRMNETLEAMARALFQSWFVDATQAGLPKGWTVRALYDCANYINGSAFRHEHFSSERLGLPIIKIGELKDGITGQTKFTEEILEEKYRITTGEILFSWSGSPDTSIDTFVWTGREGWLNQHIFKIQFKRPLEKFFVYYLLRHFMPEFIEIARNKQTTGLGHVTAQDLKRLKTAFPPDDVLVAFNRIAEPLFGKSYNNNCESRTLAALRDALLPKLLSGELRVPAAQKHGSA